MITKRVIAAAALAVMPLSLTVPAHAAPVDSGVQSSILPGAVSAEGARHAQTILTRVNELRTSKGLTPVTRYTQLDTVAQNWSEQMAASRTMEHNPTYAESYPKGWTSASENVAMRSSASNEDIGEELFKQWLNSPGHYENMVSPDANSIGIGIAQDSTGAWYATQNFAAYQNASAAGLTQSGGSGSSNSSSNGGSQDSPAPSPQTTTEPAPQQDAPSEAPSAPSTQDAPEPEPTASGTTGAPESDTPSPSPTAPATSQAPSTQDASPRTDDQLTGSQAAATSTTAPAAAGASSPGRSLARTGPSIAVALLVPGLVGVGLVLLLRRRRHN